MSFRKLSAFVLAGTFSLSGVALISVAPASAMTPVKQLKDVKSNHWAYNAIKTLVDKYHVMEGFPDKTFRGSKTVTRYELAASLAKVMARVQQIVGNTGGGAVDVEPGVNPEDLRTIARLQREFREELDTLKARQDTMDSRLTALEKRVKLSGTSQIDYRDFTGSSPLAGNSDFRGRTSLYLDAAIADNLSLSSSLNIDLYNPQSQGNPFLIGASAANAAPITNIYPVKSILSYNPGWANLAGGLGSVREYITLGSTLADPFATNVWRNATGGYGFVGTPGLNPAANGQTPAQLGVGMLNGNGAPVWLPGTNVLDDVLDPNNSQAFAPTGDLLVAAQGNFGPVRIGLADKRGALSGFNTFNNQILPAAIPQFQTWQMGGEALATLGLDLGVVRLAATGASPNFTLNQNLRDKTLGFTADVGTDALGLTAQVLGNSSYTLGDFQASKAAVRLGSENLFDTGFGLSLGTVMGNVLAAQPLGQAIPAGNNLFGSQADYTSLGLVVKTPAVFLLPSFTIAAQNTAPGTTAAGFTGNVVASGLSVGAGFDIFGLPTLNAEYSLGKFNAGQDNTLWSNAANWSSEQLTLSSMVKF